MHLHQNFWIWSPVSDQNQGSAVGVAREFLVSTSFYIPAYKLTLFSGLSGFIAEDYSLMDKVSLGVEYKLSRLFDVRGSVVRHMDSSVQEFNLGLGLFLDKLSFSQTPYNMRIDYNFTIPYFPFEKDITHSLGISILGKVRSISPVITTPKNSIKTKDTFVTIEGRSEPSSKVYLFKNNIRVAETKSNGRGDFEFKKVSFKSGRHSFYVKSQVPNESLSNASNTIIVLLDTDKPKLDFKMDVSKDGQFIFVDVFSNEPLSKVQGKLDKQTFFIYKSERYSFMYRIPFPNQFRTDSLLLITSYSYL